MSLNKILKFYNLDKKRITLLTHKSSCNKMSWTKMIGKYERI